jgi:signal recognition particle subunit SRP54
MKRIEAIIDSMTPEERRTPGIIKASRRRRIALGSGTSTAEVNRLLKQFVEMQKMMKMFSGGKMPRIGGGLGALLGR